MHIKYHGEIFVNWTAKAQKAVLKVTNPRRSAIEQANMQTGMGPNKSNNANMTTVPFKAAPGICWIKHH